MSDALSRYQKLQSKTEGLKRDADRAAGALAQTMKRLKKEFGCSSIKEARTLLKKLKREKASAEGCLASGMKKLEEKWSHVLE